MNRTIHILFTILIVSCSFRVEAKLSRHQEHVNTLSNLIGSIGEDLHLDSGFLSKSSKIEIVNHSSIQFQKVDSSKKMNYDGVEFNINHTTFFYLVLSLELTNCPIHNNLKHKLYKVFCNYRL